MAVVFRLFLRVLICCLLPAATILTSTGAIFAGEPGAEVVISHCNDALYQSDGGGVSACIEGAARFNGWRGGYGLYGATPEFKNGRVTGDNLKEVAVFTVGVGKLQQISDGELFIQGHLGLEGGIVDDLGKKLLTAVHSVFGVGVPALTTSKKTKVNFGVSGWARSNGWNLKQNNVTAKLQPYLHGSLGLDTLEGGGGLLIAFQPASANKNMALLLPKNGSYLTNFGGDGFGVFAAGRLVARETLYKKLAKPFLLETGLTSQYTINSSYKLGWTTSCTTKPYKGAPKADCKGEIRLGYVFSGR